MSKTFSQNEVAGHKKPDDLWIIVDDNVYDMTQFQAEHPGERRIISWTSRTTDLMMLGGQKSECNYAEHSALTLSVATSTSKSGRQRCI